MKILLFRSNNMFASRVNKYINYYKRNNIKFTAIGWDRSGEARNIENYEFCKYKAEKNAGGLKAMMNHSMWMWFVFKYLVQHRDVTTIHACDLNTAFPAALYKKIFNPKVVLIFDACDWFSDNFARYSLLCKILRRMEKFAYHNSDELIICEPERKAQIRFKLRKEPLILPNIPELEKEFTIERNEKYLFDNKKITIGYFGGFSLGRFLPELLDTCKTGKFNLLIAGYGNKIIEDKCNEVKDLPNVKYFGRLSMEEGLQMSGHADIIFTMYCKTNPNHIFAAPNKYYEALYLGKPMLTTKGIIVENKVLNNNIGYSIEENQNDFLDTIDNINKKDLEEKGKNASRLWNTTYKDYVNMFFANIYSRIVK